MHTKKQISIVISYISGTHQDIVMYAKNESEQLLYVRINQKKLRMDDYTVIFFEILGMPNSSIYILKHFQLFSDFYDSLVNFRFFMKCLIFIKLWIQIYSPVKSLLLKIGGDFQRLEKS